MPDARTPDARVVPDAQPGSSTILQGTIVTPDDFFDGELRIVADKIDCVGPRGSCAAAGATTIDTQGVIAPGLIDTHNHILFDIFDDTDWTPPQLYQDHDQWTKKDPGYAALLDVKQCLSDDSQGKPAWCSQTPYGTTAGSLRCEMDKYGELKGLIAGTTSIVGLPGTSSACFGSLARSIDVPQNGLGLTDKIQTAVALPSTKTAADTICSHFADGTTDAYLIHVGEGIDQSALDEFTALDLATSTEGCLLAPQTAITHGTAFGMTEFQQMAAHGMKLIWSPSSNVFLYGDTANIPLAIAAGVTVALAPDWSIGSSPNLLDELRFAQAWDATHWGGVLSAQDLVKMVTTNAASALGLGGKIGTIAVGAYADLTVFAGPTDSPYDTILAATPETVSLVMVGGVPLYGDPALAPAGCETLDICGTPRFACVATTDTANKLDQTYADIKSAIDQALLDADALTPDDGYTFAPIAPLLRCP